MTIIQGDCLKIMKSMNENSIDFIVTDPPYGLKFMGKSWDYDIPNIEYWKEMLRLLKPGGHILAMGGSRTFHRLTCKIEDAGAEIRDVIMWVYGSGFPKSHNNFGFEGYGTALKPAYEPIILAMKPLDGTFKQNADKWGVAGINIDDCRIETIDKWKRDCREQDIIKQVYGKRTGIEKFSHKKGRWPANIILDEKAAEMLDKQSGILKLGSGNRRPNGGRKIFKGFGAIDAEFSASIGGASRFFYCAKASSRERNRGLDGMPKIDKVNGNKWTDQDYRVIRGERHESAQSGPRQNSHPTVKPIALMKYLINLLAPPGKPICLDPFCGSGSTLVAAKELGIKCIGIEKESEYCEIAKNRILYLEK